MCFHMRSSWLLPTLSLKLIYTWESDEVCMWRLWLIHTFETDKVCWYVEFVTHWYVCMMTLWLFIHGRGTRCFHMWSSWKSLKLREGRIGHVFCISCLGASLSDTYWGKCMTYEYAIRVWHTLKRARWSCVLNFIFGRIPFTYILRQIYDPRVCDTGMTYTEKGALALCFVLHIWAHPFQTNVWHTRMRYGYDIHWKGRGDPLFSQLFLSCRFSIPSFHPSWDTPIGVRERPQKKIAVPTARGNFVSFFLFPFPSFRPMFFMQ